MIETILDIRTKDGTMESFICRPEREGPHPAVLFLMDAPGIREELRDMARRLATVGYYVVLPNLYYRAGRDSFFGPTVLTKGDPEYVRMRAIRTKMTIPPGDGRRGCDARLSRWSARVGETRSRRRARLLHERALRARRSGTLSRSHRRRRVLLRNPDRQRCRGEPSPLIEQMQRRALHRLRRA